MVDLAFETVHDGEAVRAIAFLHGILGRGNNLRAIAKRFVAQRPNWSALLVDLRGHGRSPKGTPAPSVEAAARDIVALAKCVKQPLGAVVGHSFGGKVALELARLSELPSLEHVAVIDSVPGVRIPVREGDDPLSVIDTLASLPKTFATRSEFVDAVVATGKTHALAQWLASSVEKKDGHVQFMLDLDEVRGLILDYFSRDLWPVVEHPPGPVRIHLLIGGRSTSYSSADRERAASIAALHGQVTVDVLPAGHWVHVDDPDGLLKRLLEYIAE